MPAIGPPAGAKQHAVVHQLTIARHGVTLRFDTSSFASGLPYVYEPITRGRLYEERFLEYIQALTRPGGYVDVGAHLGTHTVWFATECKSTHVYAFEPVARYADVVEQNVELNGLAAKVTVRRVGLADEPGRATNYLSPEHQMGFVADAAGVTEEFPVERMDDLVTSPIAVIKIDVEGMEAAVLRGAKRILSKYKPVVFAECHTVEAADALAAQLRQFGYQPTGRVFNATPTYEFQVVPSRSHERVRWVLERLRPVFARLPVRVRKWLRSRSRGL